MNPESLNNEKVPTVTIDKNENRSFKYKAGIFLAGVTGVSAVIGFGSTLAAVKKQDPSHFNKGMVSTLEMTEPGMSLALRALGWGTVYAFTGCGILFYGIWKISGAQNFQEFRQKVGSALPRIPKKPSEGRTEFSGMNDLLEYLSSQKSKK